MESKAGSRTMLHRTDAQRRVNQILAFKAELAALKAAGQSPLTREQESELADYHDRVIRRLAAEFDIDASETAGQLSRGMRLVSFFGAIALTAAIYSLVERFWGRLELREQTFLLTLFPLMALVGMELSARRERTLYVASLFAMVAYGTFWLAVGVLSWRLNIPLTPPFLWLGAVFGFALAVPYRFRVVLAIALYSLAVAIAATIFAVGGIEWPEIFSRFDLLTIAGFSLISLAAPLAQLERSFAAVTRGVALTIGCTGLLILSANGESSAAAVDVHVIEVVYQLFTLAICVGAIVLAIRRGWNETLAIASITLALFLLIRYIDWFWELMPRYVFFLVLAGLAFAWLLAMRRMRGRLAEARR
jgi:hypothetical protein